MHFVSYEGVRRWHEEGGGWTGMTRGIGRQRSLDRDFAADVLGLPLHLAWAIERLRDEAGAPVAPDHFDSIPFYSLCKGFLMPMSGVRPEKAARFFGLQVGELPSTAEREALLVTFLEKELGMSLTQKLACVVGDPFLGRAGGLKRDSLMRLLLSTEMVTRHAMLDRLTVLGDVALLYAEHRPDLKGTPPLTASEVLELLRLLPDAKRNLKLDLLRSLLFRCGKLEAYFLVKLVLRKAGFGIEYQGPMLARAMARHFSVHEEQVAHAMALTDVFEVTRILEKEGVAGLRAIRMQPLVPIRPALAGGTTDDIEGYPVWVERKYDGIRFMLHKSTDSRGSMLCGAYTRGRRDWLELVPGLDSSIKMLPCRTAIVDGELYGTVATYEGPRPATVYEVYAFLQGERARPVNLKFAAFDLIYLNGTDLTQMPLNKRQELLKVLVGPLTSMPLPVPMVLAEGQMASSAADVNKLYAHFRNQGYEGVIAKAPVGPYMLAARDPSWLKRKPLVTLDLVLLGGVLAVSEGKAGRFGSYVIGARTPEGDFKDVGDVAGVDVARESEIQQEIMREGLMTGRRIERKSMSGVRPGMELRPHIVVTVKFEGVVKDSATGEIKLRDPKLVLIRSDKTASEVDTTQALEELLLKSRVG